MTLIEYNKKEIENYIKQVQMFNHLDNKETAFIIEQLSFYSCQQDEKIISEGDINNDLYAVIKGSVNICVDKESKKDIYISTIGAGEVFGEAAIFLDHKRTANVITNEPTILMSLNQKAFMNFISKHPKSGIKILMRIIYSLLQKLREANQELAYERKSFVKQEDVDKMIDHLLSNN